MDLVAIFAGVTAIFTAGTAIFTAVMANILRRASTYEAKAQQSQVFLEIVKIYNLIYDRRNKLLEMNIKWEDFHRKYPDNNAKLNSPEWQDLRQVAACYEMLGVLLKHQYLDSNVLFDMFFLNPRDDTHNLTLWEHVRELIYGMRIVYNRYQYENWEHLIEQEKKYLLKKEREYNKREQGKIHP